MQFVFTVHTDWIVLTSVNIFICSDL